MRVPPSHIRYLPYLFTRSVTPPCVCQAKLQSPLYSKPYSGTSEQTFQKSHPGSKSTMATFHVAKDRFECIVLDLWDKRHEVVDNHFVPILEASLRKWKNDGVRGVSVTIPSHLAHRIPLMIQRGFDFHHANPGYVLMLKWLSETEINNFPPYANHYVGVGGFVVNDEGKVLAIKERFTGPEPLWKLPGGGADAGEDIAVTAKREVLEETGVHCEFVGVLSFRHLHNFRYGNSDFYIAALMRATSTEIRADPQEVVLAKWLTLDEFSKDLHAMNKFILDSYVQYKKTGIIMKDHKITKYIRQDQHIDFAYRAERT